MESDVLDRFNARMANVKVDPLATANESAERIVKRIDSAANTLATLLSTRQDSPPKVYRAKRTVSLAAFGNVTIFVNDAGDLISCIVEDA